MARVEPFYQRVRNDLEEKIRSDFYKKGEYIPSEGRLEVYYKVSRTTIRNAISDLVTDGYLTIVRGKGTRVTSSKLITNIPNLISFTEIIKQQGVTSSLLEAKLRRLLPTEEIAEKLEIGINEEVFEFYRIRTVDDEPISIHCSYIPCKYVENYDVHVFEKKQSFYQVLKEDFNITIQMAKDNISAELADTHLAKVLNIEKGDPILHIDRVAYDQSNMIIEYSKVYYRADRYSHAVILK